jgi:hypothetical protein
LRRKKVKSEDLPKDTLFLFQTATGNVTKIPKVLGGHSINCTLVGSKLYELLDIKIIKVLLGFGDISEELVTDFD